MINFRSLLAALALLALAACPMAHADDLTEQDKARLAEPRFNPPANWQWGGFINADGAKIRYGSVEAPEPKGTVLILPGYADPLDDFCETTHELVAAGFSVWMMDWRGQGGSEHYLENTQKAYAIGFEHDVADLIQFATTIVKRGPDEKLVMIGESMGGNLGLRALHDRPDLFRVAAFSSPAIGFQTGKFPVWTARTLAFGGTFLGLGQSYAPGAHDWIYDPDAGGDNDRDSHDRPRSMFYQALYRAHPEIRIGGATYRFVREFFRSSDLEKSDGYLAAIKPPVLFGQAPEDQVVEVESMTKGCAAMPACTLKRFDGARHALFHEADQWRKPWIEAVIAFIEPKISDR
jgi:lysophospholipase